MLIYIKHIHPHETSSFRDGIEIGLMILVLRPEIFRCGSCGFLENWFRYVLRENVGERLWIETIDFELLCLVKSLKRNKRFLHADDGWRLSLESVINHAIRKVDYFFIKYQGLFCLRCYGLVCSLLRFLWFTLGNKWKCFQDEVTPVGQISAC